jgi:hypothetical protein
MLDPVREAVSNNVSYGQYSDKTTVKNCYKATFRHYREEWNGDISNIFRLCALKYGERGFQGQCSESARRSSLSYPITPIHRFAVALAQQSALPRVMQETRYGVH